MRIANDQPDIILITEFRRSESGHEPLPKYLVPSGIFPLLKIYQIYEVGLVW